MAGDVTSECKARQLDWLGYSFLFDFATNTYLASASLQSGESLLRNGVWLCIWQDKTALCLSRPHKQYSLFLIPARMRPHQQNILLSQQDCWRGYLASKVLKSCLVSEHELQSYAAGILDNSPVVQGVYITLMCPVLFGRASKSWFL